jgi:hypothetical protein
MFLLYGRRVACQMLQCMSICRRTNTGSAPIGTGLTLGANLFLGADATDERRNF